MSHVLDRTGAPVLPYDSAKPQGADIVRLYRELRAAPAESEDFELLMAEFNRVCEAAPESVVRALQQEAFTV